MQLSLEFSLASWFGSGNVLVAMRSLLAMNIMSVSNFSANLLRGLDNILSVIGMPDLGTSVVAVSAEPFYNS